MPLRPATTADLPALAAIYDAGVRALGPQAYTPEQIDAWAAFAHDHDAFRAFVLDVHTLVALHPADPATCVGFAGVSGNGHVASLYVHPHHMRQGIASTLLDALIAHARTHHITSLHTEASTFSRPVFERAGFHVTEIEQVRRNGVPFTRFRMRRG